MVAAEVAKKLEGQFDIIHAHDWLTYYAGIAAKQVSGKPLVVHIHATEYDRSGENINRTVYDIERAGMQAADLVMAVSNLTRNIVINRYGIAPDKVVTIHNAVSFAADKDNEIKRGDDEKIVTFLGRITTRKGRTTSSRRPPRLLKRCRNVPFCDGRQRRYDEPRDSTCGTVGHCDRFPLHGLSERRTTYRKCLR